MRDFLQALKPSLPHVGYVERFRAAGGALFGIAATGFVTLLALGPSAGVPLLVAPMGASSVLLFAVPASPLAQPWSIFGGNMLAGLVGVTAVMFIADPFVAAAVAAAGAIFLMLSFRCVHPPSGAVALTAVLGGDAVHQLGYAFVIWPVAVNTLILLLAAFLYNNLTGRSYPHRLEAAQAARPVTGDKPPSRRIGFRREDIDAALEDYGQLLDVDPIDLEAILRSAEFKALQRRSDKIRCADIMSRDVRAVAPGDTISAAMDIMRRNDIKVLPVTDEDARVVGIVTQTDLIEKAVLDPEKAKPRLGIRLGRALRLQSVPQSVVRDIMTTPVRSAEPDMAVVDLLPLMADGGLHHLPVVGAGERLLGIITQSDVIGALMHDRIEGPAKLAQLA